MVLARLFTPALPQIAYCTTNWSMMTKPCREQGLHTNYEALLQRLRN